MKYLIDDWPKVLKRAWSVRLALISAVLSGAEITLQFLAPQYGGGFAVAAGVAATAAAIARLVAQKKMREDKQ